MQTRHPEIPDADSSRQPSLPLNVIDLTSRLPKIPDSQPPIARVPASGRVPRRLWIVAFAACLLAGAVSGAWLARAQARRDVQQHLAKLLEAPALELPWQALGGAPLRVLAPEVRPQDLEPTVRALLDGYDSRAMPLPSESWTPILLTVSALHTLHACAPQPSETCLRPALDALELVQSRTGSSPEALNNLAIGYAMAGRTVEALELLRTALMTVPGDPVILFNAAQVCRALEPEGRDSERSFLHRYLILESEWKFKEAMARRFRDITSHATQGGAPSR